MDPANAVPVLVVADPGYVGQEEVADELGPGFTVEVATSYEAALEAVLRLPAPLVLLPDNLEPVRGADALGRLAEHGLDFVGLLLVDEPDLPRLRAAPALPGVHALLTRPLRPGALGLHVRAGANARADRLADRARGAQAGGGLNELIKALRHELRGQLQGMMGLANLLGEFERERLSAEGRDWCRRLEGSGERLCRLVDDLVTYLRLGRQELERASVDVAALAEDVFEQRPAERGAPPPDFAYEGPRIRVRADRRALAAALACLVDNAVRFADGPPRVRVSVSPGDPSVEGSAGFTLQVADAGPGVPEAARQRIFTLFERHHVDADGLRAGAGVGLAIVALVAERHGGRAWVDDGPDGGAVFCLWLPS